MTKQIPRRLPGELHERLKAAADLNRRSLHAEILWRLEHSEQPDEDKASTTRQHQIPSFVTTGPAPPAKKVPYLPTPRKECGRLFHVDIVRHCARARADLGWHAA